jgi:hypothetical protein
MVGRIDRSRTGASDYEFCHAVIVGAKEVLVERVADQAANKSDADRANKHFSR